MRLYMLAIVGLLLSCEDGPAYESARCKDLRERVRRADARIAYILSLPTPVDIALIQATPLQLQIREVRDENPECFDASL